MRKIVFDIETSNVFQDVASNDPAALDMSVCCIYDYDTDKYLGFTQENLADMWPYFEKADMIIGFNSDHFDIPILQKYFSGNLSKIKSLDLLKEVKNSLGKRIKLDTIAEATLGRNKTGHGLDAIVWWRNGERQKVMDYCIEDVRITKDVYEYALKNNLLKYTDGNEIKDIKLDTSNWEEKAPSMTLF